jgi:hypothetical protein
VRKLVQGGVCMSWQTRKLSLERTVQAPAWGNTISAHLDYLCWHLETHPDVLENLFKICDDHQRRKPGKRFSVPDAFAVLRWQGFGVNDDVFAMNNNLLACYARLYVRERPEARELIDLRTSWIDSLNALERPRLYAALARG